MLGFCLWLLCCFKQKTAYEMRISDWSSDVCSSDLLPVAVRHFRPEPLAARRPAPERRHVGLGPGFIDEEQAGRINPALIGLPLHPPASSEERSVGKECVSTGRSRWSPSH